MSQMIQSLERRALFAITGIEVNLLSGIPFEPKLRDGGVLAVSGGDANEGVRVALVKRASQIDSEPWQQIRIETSDEGTKGELISGVLSDDATGKVVGAKGGPYIRVSTPGKSWFFRNIDVKRISIGMAGGTDLVAIQRDLRKRVSVDAGDGNDFIFGGRYGSTLSGGAGNDTIFAGQSNDTLMGGDGNDALVGDSGNDVMFGGAGNDTLKGGFGTDSLFGEDGDDELNGGFGGADYLYGNAGDDTIILKDQPGNRDVARGGGGKDKLLFEDSDDIFIQ